MHNVCWFGCCRSKNMQEICRLRSALEAANARIAELEPRGAIADLVSNLRGRIVELLARAERAEARIAELEASPRESFFWPIERVRSELCLTVTRAERAEAQLLVVKGRLDQADAENAELFRLKERAEAECKTMREALDIVMPTLEYYHKGSTALAKARAARNPSPVEREE